IDAPTLPTRKEPAVVQSLLKPTLRLLNHTAVVYPPGERALARDLLETLGFRVLDPQDPDHVGVGSGHWLVAFVDPDSTDVFDNIIYAGEVPAAQWEYEQALAERVAGDDGLRAALDGYNASFRGFPEGMAHFGITMDERQLDATLATIEGSK